MAVSIMKKTLLCALLAALFCASTPCPVFGQENKKTAVAVLDFFLPSLATIEKKKADKKPENPYFTSAQSGSDILFRLQKLQGFASSVFGADSRFVLIERNALKIVQKERELQKSEDFIDGYVTGQGKNIGADYLVTGDFDVDGIALTISIFSVSEQVTVAKEIVDLKKALFAFGAPLRDPVVDGTRLLSAKVFPLLMTVVEITESKKEKAKKLLLAAGLNRGMKTKVKLDIKVKEEREADGQKQTYYRTVGQAEVDKVEDDNFSILSVSEGEEEVKKLIDSGKKLYCTFKI